MKFNFQRYGVGSSVLVFCQSHLGYIHLDRGKYVWMSYLSTAFETCKTLDEAEEQLLKSVKQSIIELAEGLK